jgi:hypothetical protein
MKTLAQALLASVALSTVIVNGIEQKIDIDKKHAAVVMDAAAYWDYVLSVSSDLHDEAR